MSLRYRVFTDPLNCYQPTFRFADPELRPWKPPPVPPAKPISIRFATKVWEWRTGLAFWHHGREIAIVGDSCGTWFPLMQPRPSQVVPELHPNTLFIVTMRIDGFHIREDHWDEIYAMTAASVTCMFPVNILPIPTPLQYVRMEEHSVLRNAYRVRGQATFCGFMDAAAYASLADNYLLPIV